MGCKMVRFDFALIRRFVAEHAEYDIVVSRPVRHSRRVWRVSVRRPGASCFDREFREFIFGADALSWLYEICG